jgi:GT2 family glycosyltransferase
VFESLGGFAQDYDYGGPDTEFCWRLQLASYSLAYAPDAVIHYRHRQSLRSAAVKAYRTGRSRGRLFRDYGSLGMPRPRLAGVVFRWCRLVLTLPAAVLSRPTRWWWAEEAAGAVGRLRGSLRYKVLYL